MSPHLDVAFTMLLPEHRGGHRALIVTGSRLSMDGVAPITEIVDLAREHDA